uniref:Uncharacterized protein n=1 Tax=viral metagenome TaxID=1070528 RepID=A0A6C0C2A4_9ZZZZ
MDTTILPVLPHLFKAAPKPIPATSLRLTQIPDPYVTLKLDGSRTLLVCNGKTVQAYTPQGLEQIVTDQSQEAETCSQISILDTERINNHFYVFDALFVKGVDVRHLPTLARLREAKGILPACAHLKRLHWGPKQSITDTVYRLMQSRPKLADGSRMDAIEGFIFGSLAAPYQQDHLKFKFAITCDFLVTSTSCRSSNSTTCNVRRLNLFVQYMQTLIPFKGYIGTPNHAFVAADSHAHSSLPLGDFELHANVIMEMKLVAGYWDVIRRRYDRLRPNTLRTVQENIELQQSRHSDIHMLLHAFSRGSSSVSPLDHISNAMLRAVGTCGAIIAIQEVPAMFLPHYDDLKRELDKAADQSSQLAVVTTLVNYQILCTPPKATRSLVMTVSEVAHEAKHRGWKCTSLCSLRARDFLVGNYDLPEHITGALENVVFLLLRKTRDIEPAPH